MEGEQKINSFLVELRALAAAAPDRLEIDVRAKMRRDAAEGKWLSVIEFLPGTETTLIQLLASKLRHEGFATKLGGGALVVYWSTNEKKG